MFELLYQEGDVHILIQTRARGLRIPQTAAASAKEEFMGFVLGTIPSPHLEIKDDGIYAPLRFGRERFHCFFPWDSILQMNSTDCVVFYAIGEKKKNRRPGQTKDRPKLKVVKKED
ncbi:MAG: hypothetical protein JRG73_09460 [Deltaproteobacteria bacterium]|nr:hypothetical protein [Deltaproteobacteria bacterium]